MGHPILLDRLCAHRTIGRSFLILFLIFCCGFSVAYAQENKRLNTIYINASHPFIFGKRAMVFGYERVLKNNQTISFNIGGMSLPKIGKKIATDSLLFLTNGAESGFHAAVDYRFYLKKENKYEAPRGFYIGPYYSFNNFSRETIWDVTTSYFDGQATTDFKMNIHTIGFEFGYQTVLWDRLSVDLVMGGPGLGFYNMEAKVNGNFSAEQAKPFFDRLNNFLYYWIPGFQKIGTEASFEETGRLKKTTIGYRYMVNIGYRF